MASLSRPLHLVYFPIWLNLFLLLSFHLSIWEIRVKEEGMWEINQPAFLIHITPESVPPQAGFRHRVSSHICKVFSACHFLILLSRRPSGTLATFLFISAPLPLCCVNNARLLIYFFFPVSPTIKSSSRGETMVIQKCKNLDYFKRASDAERITIAHGKILQSLFKWRFDYVSLSLFLSVLCSLCTAPLAARRFSE